MGEGSQRGWAFAQLKDPQKFALHQAPKNRWFKTYKVKGESIFAVRSQTGLSLKQPSRNKPLTAEALVQS
ncbi:MAG: hypothetical protein RMK89_11490 [Armatimonadota bacterium]|nr:hypothetical protein [Armatimonadota bacterium]MDW8144071.1 hypothetical protein [Armatimonadota bacterium]